MERTLSQNSRNADTLLTKLTKHLASRFCRYDNSVSSIVTIINPQHARLIVAGFSFLVSIIDNITFLLRITRDNDEIKGKDKIARNERESVAFSCLFRSH